MKHFKTITDLYTTNGFPPPENPLLGVLTFEEIKHCNFCLFGIHNGFLQDCFKKGEIWYTLVW
jgi:hypothetical protein